MPTQMSTLFRPIATESFEPYVWVEKAAQYLDLKPKTLLAQARKGLIPAYPWERALVRSGGSRSPARRMDEEQVTLASPPAFF